MVGETVGLRCDQIIRLNSRKGWREYPEPLRRVSHVAPKTGQALLFLSMEFCQQIKGSSPVSLSSAPSAVKSNCSAVTSGCHMQSQVADS